MKVIGRLSTKNPAYVLPSLRKTLLQLMTELGQHLTFVNQEVLNFLLSNLEYSEEANSKKEAANMLGHLINAAPRLIKPYVASILTVLFDKIKTDTNPAVVACVLSTLGKLAEVGGQAMHKYLPDLLPKVIDTLRDNTLIHSSGNPKREVAVRTLGQLIESTGYVITPYKIYPQLLSTLLGVLKPDSPWSTRCETIKCIGIIGALDPYQHKQILKRISGNNKKQTAHSRGSGFDCLLRHLTTSMITDTLPGMGSEDYYPTVAINALLKILRDSSFGQVFNLYNKRRISFLNENLVPYTCH